jgi:hypothetical protein
MRLIVQPIAGGFELCARLGLVFVPATNLTRVIHFGMAGQLEATGPLRGLEDGKLVHAVLGNSPSARAGIQSRDILFAINGKPWRDVRLLTFSDHHPSEITAVTFVGWQFAAMNVLIRVPPHPYRPLSDIHSEAADIVAARPTLDATPYRNPHDDPDPGMVRLLEGIRSRQGRRRR